MQADLLPVLVHIQASLDTDLTAASLAQRSGLSESTLHRHIVEATGETPRQHVERLRLERAASQLLLRDSTILEVALDNGFASHEVFARAFSRHFGTSPSAWRDRRSAGDLGAHERQPGLTERTDGVSLSSTRLVEMRPVDIAFLRHIGPYGEIDGNSWAQIRTSLRELGRPGDGLPVGIAHDAPQITPPEHLRFDAGWTIEEPLPPECGLGQQTIPGGTYAVTTYVGPFSLLGEAYVEIGARIMRHADRLNFGAGDFGGSVEWYRTGSIDEEQYLNQVDITFPVTARAGIPRVLE
jgi:AraC family transcriptional regulator